MESMPGKPNHISPIALTFHVIKTEERFILNHFQPLVSSELDLLISLSMEENGGESYLTTYRMEEEEEQW